MATSEDSVSVPESNAPGAELEAEPAPVETPSSDAPSASPVPEPAPVEVPSTVGPSAEPEPTPAEMPSATVPDVEPEPAPVEMPSTTPPSGSGGGPATAVLPFPSLYVAFEPGNGDDVVHDAASPAEDGTLHGPLTFGAGMLGNAATFTAGSFVDFGDVFDPGTGALTVALWFRAVEPTATQVLLGKGNRFSADEGYSVFIEDGTLVVRARQNEASSPSATQVTGLVANNWYHLAFVYDPSRLQLRGYLNGSISGWVPGGGGAENAALSADAALDTSEALLVGARKGGSTPFNGEIDDLAVWSQALSDTELAELFANGQRGGSAVGSLLE